MGYYGGICTHDCGDSGDFCVCIQRPVDSGVDFCSGVSVCFDSVFCGRVACDGDGGGDRGYEEG